MHLAIKQLKEDDALIITLFYLNQNSVEEISEITNFSVSNIKVKLFRARKKLFPILTKSTKGEMVSLNQQTKTLE